MPFVSMEQSGEPGQVAIHLFLCLARLVGSIDQVGRHIHMHCALCSFVPPGFCPATFNPLQPSIGVIQVPSSERSLVISTLHRSGGLGPPPRAG